MLYYGKQLSLGRSARILFLGQTAGQTAPAPYTFRVNGCREGRGGRRGVGVVSHWVGVVTGVGVVYVGEGVGVVSARRA